MVSSAARLRRRPTIAAPSATAAMRIMTKARVRREWHDREERGELRVVQEWRSIRAAAGAWKGADARRGGKSDSAVPQHGSSPRWRRCPRTTSRRGPASGCRWDTLAASIGALNVRLVSTTAPRTARGRARVARARTPNVPSPAELRGTGRDAVEERRTDRRVAERTGGDRGGTGTGERRRADVQVQPESTSRASNTVTAPRATGALTGYHARRRGRSSARRGRRARTCPSWSPRPREPWCPGWSASA